MQSPSTHFATNSNSSNLESVLCFPKDIFYAQTFDVDAFLSHYRRDYSLERLRNDLNIFLKVLEISMSELINKDYPDFVDLSTNLVDLDKAINDFKKPLEAMKKEVDNVQQGLDSEIEMIVSKLNEKLLIEKRRIILKLLMNWQRSLKVTTEMISNNNDSSNPNSQKINGDHIERIAFEFRQLKSSLSICGGNEKSSSVSNQNNEIDKLSQLLEKIMQDLFFSCLNENSSLNESSQRQLDDAEKQLELRHLLKSYSLLSKQRLAEQLFTDHIVKPYMEMYINEKFLDSNILKLNGIFDKCLWFMDQNELFLRLTCEVKSGVYNHNTETPVEQVIESNSNEFDFFLNSIWSQIVAYLDLNLNSIFSPADPDLFHKRYTNSFDFLAKFELKCSQLDPSFTHRFRTSQSYKYFVKKWPTHVYFQIRFQEIASKLEEDLVSTFDFDSASSASLSELNSQFYLAQHELTLTASQTLIKQLEFCWLESQCFLKSLTSQFWRLSLQLISRYCTYFIEFYLNKISNDDESGNQLQKQQQQSQIQQQQQEIPIEQLNNMSLSNNDASTIQPIAKSKLSLNELSMCILLLNDVTQLIDIRVLNFFDGSVAPVIRSSSSGLSDLGSLKEALDCSLANLNELRSVLIQYMVKSQTDECVNHLKSANDIPRLYRRTNREAPKTASSYVTQAVQVIVEFKSKYLSDEAKSESSYEIVKEGLHSIIDSTCIKYQSIANDLLESVKKMEDSLRRLRRVRPDRSVASNMANLGNVMSDDDKIRSQLYLDVVEFGQQLSDKFDGYKGDSNYEALYHLVDEVNQALSSTASAAAATNISSSASATSDQQTA